MNENLHWEHGYFTEGKCDREGCNNPVDHRLFDDYGADGDEVASLCDAHWNKSTQKKRLKRLKKSDKKI